MKLAQYLSSVLLCCLLSNTSFAQEDLRLSAFASLAAVSVDADGVEFKRDIGDASTTADGEINYKQLSLLGLQANYVLSDKFSLVGQAIFRDHPENNFDNIVRIAALTYQFSPNWQLRLGRIPQNIFQLSDSRPIGYSYPWTMPVSEFYSAFTFNSVDGIDASYSTLLGPGYFWANAAYGESTLYLTSKTTGSASIGMDNISEFSLGYEIGDWQTRVSWAQATTNDTWGLLNDFREGLAFFGQQLGWQQSLDIAEQLDTVGKTYNFMSAGLIYNNGNIGIKTEYAELKSDFIGIPDIDSAYLSFSKYYGQFVPYFLLASIDSNLARVPGIAPPVSIPELDLLVAATSALVNTGYSQKSAGIGLRININAQSAIKFQWDKKFVDRFGYNLWEADDSLQYPDKDQKIDVYSVRFDYLF